MELPPASASHVSTIPFDIEGDVISPLALDPYEDLVRNVVDCAKHFKLEYENNRMVAAIFLICQSSVFKSPISIPVLLVLLNVLILLCYSFLG